MKLQHIIIIFVIIIVPISLVLSAYINAQIKTIDYQTAYNQKLIDATYDGIKAFQLNTANNMYSTISNSKIRDIEASINVFYTSLGTNMGSSGYSQEELRGYTPAILFTLYDGYYIYSNYYDTAEGVYKYGLKPFINYSCRYKKGNNYDFVVNYTLDNTITIIGTVKGKYVVKTGHLLTNSNIPNLTNDIYEILTENLIILNDDEDNTNPQAEPFQYIVYNSQKIYKDNNAAAFAGDKNDTGENGRKRYFYYSSEYKKDYVTDIDTIKYLNAHLTDDKQNILSDSAKKYYDEAITGTVDSDGNTIPSFTEWVKTNLNDITQADAVDAYGNPIEFSTALVGQKIFDISEDNNPLKSNSAFNEHRMNVIRKSIETNLISAITTFTNHAVVGYEFSMPKLEEDEWYKLENNVCMLTFLQGIPIGAKIYNNYCIVSNNTNQETVGNDSIYIVDSDGEYHKPGCLELIRKLQNNEVEIKGAYPASEFERKTVSLTGADANAHSQLLGADAGNFAYYYPESYTPCYDCIVTASQTYSTDDIIADTVQDNKGNKVNVTSMGTSNQNLRQWYLTALARSRHNLYLTNGYFGY